jgi:cytochrome b6-f complex iron-sulfur subunit
VVALFELIAVGIMFLKGRKATDRSMSGAKMVNCGPVENFQPGSVTAFVRGRFYMARLADGGFLAISRQCTHLGCTVPWIEKEKRFACPCHASTFDITGQVIDTPAQRALDLYPVIIENGILSVETKQRIRRSGFNKDQAVYPKSL